MEILSTLKEKIVAMFSGEDSVSYGRFISFMSFIALIFWTSILIYKLFHAQTISATDLRTAIPDIPTNWLYLICIPYGLTKMGDIVNNIMIKIKGQ